MDPKEACERFEMFLSAVIKATERSLSTVQQLLENGERTQASNTLDDIQESIDDMLSAFDRLRELAGEPRRYQLST